MLDKVFGANSQIGSLKDELDASARAARRIAHRVANASTDSFVGTFDDALAEAGATDGDGVDLESEMVALADEQLRFEAATQLLSRLYQHARTAVRQS